MLFGFWRLSRMRPMAKGNAAMRIDRRDELELEWKLFRRHQPRNPHLIR